MATAANLTVLNYAGGNVTYKVLDVDGVNGKTVWADDSAGSLLGFRKLLLQRKMPKDEANGVIRLQMKVSRPVLDGVTGALSYTDLGTVDYVFPAKASQAERRETHAAMKSFLGNAVVTAAVDTFEVPY